MYEILIANAAALIAAGLYIHALHKRLGNAEEASEALAGAISLLAQDKAALEINGTNIKAVPK